MCFYGAHRASLYPRGLDYQRTGEVGQTWTASTIHAYIPRCKSWRPDTCKAPDVTHTSGLTCYMRAFGQPGYDLECPLRQHRSGGSVVHGSKVVALDDEVRGGDGYMLKDNQNAMGIMAYENPGGCGNRLRDDGQGTLHT